MSHDRPRRTGDAPPLRLVAGPESTDVQDDVPPGYETDHLEPAEDEDEPELLPAVREDRSPATIEGTVVPRWRAPLQTRPVFAVWIRDAEERVHAARWAATYTKHRALFHGARLPVYVARTAAHSPRGLRRSAWAWFCWVSDREAHALRINAVARGQTGEYLALVRERNERVKTRLSVSGGVAAGAVVLATVFGLEWSWAPYALVGVGVAVLGYVGRRLDKPFIAPAVLTSTEAPRLTPEIVIRALGSLGMPLINQAIAKGPGITFASDIARDGPGWRAEVDLPYGVTATDVIDKRDKLASGLRRPLGCVWPEPVTDEHAGRLILWVGDADMSKSKQPAWPLAKTGEVDLFAPSPFGTDQRGRFVPLTLMFTSVVIGAIPRMGKTFLLRLLLLIAALDVRAELHLYDMKGTGDLSPLEPVAHRYRAGEEDEDIDYALADFRALRTELRRRAKVIRGLPKDLCPENKVTPELAGKKSLGLHPIIIGADECQVWFEHPEHGPEFEKHCTDLVKRGPALGIVLMLATQRPDAKSLPTGISANASVRMCLKVMGQLENDMVLGTSQYKNGVRATLFSWADKGICYFIGEGADARLVRSMYVDAPAAERIAKRARVLRAAAGTLSGHCLGEELVAEAEVSFIGDVAAVIDPGEEKVWLQTLADRLADVRPALYGAWADLDATGKARQMSASLKPYGIKAKDVWGRGPDGEERNWKGIERDAVLAALEKETRA